MSIPTLTLSSHNKIPRIGLGTYNLDSGVIASTIKSAVEAGYRMFDCAEKYKNEKEIGAALKIVFDEGKIRREDIYIISKLNCYNHAANDVEIELKQTLVDLQMSYVDLYLIHWPISFDPQVPLHVTWAAMEKVQRAGLTKDIGVSNFNVQLLHDLLTYATIKPVCNQIEINPFLQQPDLIMYCQKQNVVCMGYCPLARPSPSTDTTFTNINANPVILDIAKKHNRVPSQIVLRWGLQRSAEDYLTGERVALTNISLIPRASTASHLQENLAVFDFVLDEDDVGRMAELERGLRLYDGIEPYNVPIFA